MSKRLGLKNQQLRLQKQLSMRIKKTLLVAVFFVCQNHVVAAEYSIDSDIKLTGRFDDNSRLTTGFKDELYGSVLANRLDFSRATEKSNLSAGLNLENNSYNIEAFSTFDQSLNLSYIRGTERGSWNISGSVDRDSTLDTESTTQGSGLLDLLDSRITSNRLSLGWNRNVTDRHVLTWDAAANLVQYDSESRVDYKFGNTSLLWQYILNERLRLQANTSYSVLTSDTTNSFPINSGNILRIDRQVDNEQSTTRLQIGIYYLFSENLNLDALVGQSTVDTDRVDTFVDISTIGSTSGVRINEQGGKNDGVTYSMNLNYSAESKAVSLSASSSNSVNSNGVLVLTTSVGLEGNWYLSPKRTLFGSVSQFDQETSGNGVAVFNDRTLATLIFQYKYRFTKEWTGSFIYRLDEQKQSTQDRKAYSNEWALTLEWRPTTLKWSR